MEPEDFGGGGKPLIISSCSRNLYSLACFNLKQTFSVDADNTVLSINQTPLEQEKVKFPLSNGNDNYLNIKFCFIRPQFSKYLGTCPNSTDFFSTAKQDTMRQLILSTSEFTWLLVSVNEIWYKGDERIYQSKMLLIEGEKYYWKKWRLFS